jgi:hypothetical protein
MSCVTPECKAVEEFVRSLIGDRPGVLWSVLDPANEDAIYLKIWLSGGHRELKLDVPSATLKEATKMIIQNWLLEIAAI